MAGKWLIFALKRLVNL